MIRIFALHVSGNRPGGAKPRLLASEKADNPFRNYLCSSYQLVVLGVQKSIPIHSISRCINTLYIYDMNL